VAIGLLVAGVVMLALALLVSRLKPMRWHVRKAQGTGRSVVVPRRK
jgi:hypothetical protein